jgi:hypothetical protein
MKPDPRFVRVGQDFWANVRLVSQHVGYTQRSSRTSRGLSKKGVPGSIKIPSRDEIQSALNDMELSADHLFDQASLATTSMGQLLLGYFAFRAEVLNSFVRPRLMNKVRARKEFLRLQKLLRPNCPLPMNKQKGEKQAPAYFTGIINMLIESNAAGLPCDYDPRQLTTITKNIQPFRTLARRVDGAFPAPVNPIAVWEIKEYYYTTTFGSRVADGVYETLLDGLELCELRQQGIHVQHYLMIDDYFTWWDCGRSYLCRIIDMLHMGYVDEVLFGSEVFERMPAIVRGWVSLAKKRS